MRIGKVFSFLLILLALMAALSSCGHKDGDKAVDKDGEAEIPYIETMEELESGNVYVCHDGKFYSPVFESTNFDRESAGSSEKKTAWFDEESFDNIPTLYEGDYLVYYMDEAFQESFSFERYRYIGYTIGLSNLTKKQTGRYCFDALSDNKNICEYSDAARLSELNAEGVILETIGKATLRSGNISAGGLILGLSKDELYKTEVYVGTKLHVFTLRADVIGLTSMSSENVSDYTFMKNRIIRINIPETFNTGYYCVNGSGIFRYVKGKSYDDNTDFNIENEKVKKEGEDDSFKGIESEPSGPVKIPFVVQREGDIRCLVTVENEQSARFEYETPRVRIIGPDAVYSVPQEEEPLEFVKELHLSTGQYYLSIEGLQGRAYEYIVTAKKE